MIAKAMVRICEGHCQIPDPTGVISPGIDEPTRRPTNSVRADQLFGHTVFSGRSQIDNPVRLRIN